MVETFVVTFQSVPLVSTLMHCVARGCIRFRHAILITWYYLVDSFTQAATGVPVRTIRAACRSRRVRSLRHPPVGT